MREQKNVDTFYVVPNCFRNPVLKFHILMLLFLLVAGHQKILTVTLSKNILFKNVFEACDRGECKL